MLCECHTESGPHDLCCGYEDGRSPDCPMHGDGSGTNAVAQPIRRTLPEQLDAARSGQEFAQVLNNLFGAGATRWYANVKQAKAAALADDPQEETR